MPMWWRKAAQLPPFVRERVPKDVHAAAQAESGEWLAACGEALWVIGAECGGANAELGVTKQPSGVTKAEPGVTKAEPAVTNYPWWQFANGAFQGEERRLQLSFIDAEAEQLEFTLAERGARQFVAAITERIDDSIVHQQFVELPSGVTARGQVRRGSDGELFAQVPWDEAAGEADRVVLAALERELLEAVGI